MNIYTIYTYHYSNNVDPVNSKHRSIRYYFRRSQAQGSSYWSWYVFLSDLEAQVAERPVLCDVIRNGRWLTLRLWRIGSCEPNLQCFQSSRTNTKPRRCLHRRCTFPIHPIREYETLIIVKPKPRLSTWMDSRRIRASG